MKEKKKEKVLSDTKWKTFFIYIVVDGTAA